MEVFDKQNWCLHWAGKAGGVWRLLIDCSNDQKSAGYEKGQCLKDYHWRYGHGESLHKISTKTAEWRSKEVLHAGVWEDYWASSNWNRLASESHHWWWDMDFWVRPRDQALGQSVEGSDAAEAKESKRVKVILIPLFDVRGIIKSEFLPQSASLQGDPVVYTSLSAWEETRIVAGEIMAASLQQCNCLKSP